MSTEDDHHFLDTCLVPTADLTQIASGFSPRCIALGRTGSGKSAIAHEILRTHPNSAKIDPEALSLGYISNSDILRFFESVGIDLNIFYQLLWRHVLVVEVLKLKKAWSDEATSRRLLGGLFEKFAPNPKKTRALNYLFSFGESFWADTEQRVREVVRRIEDKFEDAAGISVDAFKVKLKADLKENKTNALEETTEIVYKANKVVQEVQIQELNLVMYFLAEDVFNDKNEKYCILIDDLDTGWVDDSIRYQLIRALIETIRKFRRVSNLKIVIGLRADLYETMLHKTNVAGFQTEKYDDFLLRILWTRDELFEMAEKRIAFLFKDQYTNKPPSFYDIFPRKVGTQDSFDYLTDRTLMRPRDLISFMNECLFQSAGASSISQNNVRSAEAAYSKKRMRSLADEWIGHYGDVDDVIGVLRNLDSRFRIPQLSESILESLCIKLVAGDQGEVSQGMFTVQCNSIAQSSGNYSQLRRSILECLYVIGAIGVKMSAGKPFEWSYRNEPLLNYEALHSESMFAIHPMLFRELNIRADPSRVV